MTITFKDEHKPLIVYRKNKSGVGTFGLYVAAIECDDDKKLRYEHRFFLAMNTLCTYKRAKGNGRSNWSLEKFDSFDLAMADLLTRLVALPGGKAVMVNGAPLLVELDGADIVAIEKGLTPQARTLGSGMMNRREEIDDDTWTFPEATATATPKAV